MVREYDLVASYKMFSSSFSDNFGAGQFASRDKLRYPYAKSEKKKEQVLARHAPPSALVTGALVTLQFSSSSQFGPGGP
jgi:hypothetical protein